MPRILVLLFMLSTMLFSGCSDEKPIRYATAEELANVLWLPLASNSEWKTPFCLLADGAVLVAGPGSIATTWSFDAKKPSGFMLFDANGNSRWFAAQFDANNTLNISLAGNLSAVCAAQQLVVIPAGTRYNLNYWRSSNKFPTPDDQVYVVFDYENQIRGFSGVNNFFGGYELSGQVAVNINNLASTRRGGPHLAFEQAFLQELADNINTYLVVGNQLLLYDDTTLVMILDKTN